MIQKVKNLPHKYNNRNKSDDKIIKITKNNDNIKNNNYNNNMKITFFIPKKNDNIKNPNYNLNYNHNMKISFFKTNKSSDNIKKKNNDIYKKKI